MYGGSDMDLIDPLGAVVAAILLFILFGLPLIIGLPAAKKAGISRHWFWFGLYPFAGWVLCIICVRKVRYNNGLGELKDRFRVCTQCGSRSIRWINPKKNLFFILAMVCLLIIVVTGIFIEYFPTSAVLAIPMVLSSIGMIVFLIKAYGRASKKPICNDCGKNLYMKLPTMNVKKTATHEKVDYIEMQTKVEQSPDIPND